jgi:hypothetical protein
MYEMPARGQYRRKKDDVTVTVTGCTGSSWIDTVSVQGAKLSHVRLENFWRKYELITETEG